MTAPLAAPGQVVEDGPHRHRNERRWSVRLPDGSAAVIAELLPELAAQPALRRRFVYEAERLRDLGAPALAPVLAIGPAPDPRDPAAAPPWRLRAAPAGRTLEAWLTNRAPAPIDEALAILARIADAVHTTHVAGAVLRDLEPRAVVLGDDDRVWLTDVGLARLEILSTRTATSLMLSSSPYAAPEHLRATSVDPRADVFTLGAFLWRALTGLAPFGDEPALLRAAEPLPPLGAVRAGVSDELADLVRRCLDDDADRRPESARALAAALRGEAPVGAPARERVPCQACGAALRAGMRLCLACGREAVQFKRAGVGEPDFDVILRSASDDAVFHAALHDVLTTTAETVPALNFLVGDARMYSKDEQKDLIKLPVPVFSGLTRASADALAVQLRQRKLAVKVVRRGKPARRRRVGLGLVAAGGVMIVAGGVTAAVGGLLLGLMLLAVGLGAFIGGIVRSRSAHGSQRPALAQLRAAPLALPASDRHVARLAALLPDTHAPDLRERVGELALLLQRLCDRRAERGTAPETTLIDEPVDRLTGMIEREVRVAIGIDDQLRELDEGVIVRAYAASEARGETAAARAPLLVALDRLRTLEDRRAASLHRLLEAASLLRRTVELALSGAGPADDAQVAMALAALGDGSASRT